MTATDTVGSTGTVTPTHASTPTHAPTPTDAAGATDRLVGLPVRPGSRFAVESVISAAQRRAFVELPFRLHRESPAWVPPMRRDALRALQPGGGPLAGEGTVAHWLCRDERGEVVGRIAGVVHDPFLRLHREEAHFGAFESVPDPAVAALLLGAVEQWAAERGLCRVAGPYTYSASGDVGFLTDGDTAEPVMFQPFSPPHYVDLVEAVGYTEAFAMHTYRWTRGDHGDRYPHLARRSQAVAGRHGLTVRNADLSRFDSEAEVLFTLYNRSFGQHPETTPLRWGAFAHEAKALKAVVDPDLIRIFEIDGRPVAFTFLVPNLGEILPRFGGRLTPRFLLSLRRELRRVRSAVVVMVGADPQHFGRGLGRCITAEIARSVMDLRYETVHTTWVHEGNRNIRPIICGMGTGPTRRYAVFARELPGEEVRA